MVAYPLPLAACATALLHCATVHAQALTLDYVPQTSETILDTNFTQITPVGTPPINVVGGIFMFNDVTIPAGFSVKGTGTNPMIWILAGRMTVNGTLSVDGGDGQRVQTLGGAQFAAAGGIGNCGGGSGGQGSPSTTGRSLSGQPGFDAYQVPGSGGQGGNISCSGVFSSRGSGGGGGAFATAGDPHYPISGFAQRLGLGGTADVTVGGGAPGLRPFLDADPDTDFAGFGYDFNRGAFIFGELPQFRGGQGGGGGGDFATSCALLDPTFVNDARGGGGGGGGGCLLIYALGGIEIGPSGRISADGGNGGGGEQAGSNNKAGGGAGGSGGMVVLGSPLEIMLHTHGETFANGDYSFAVSADGGIGDQGLFLSQAILSKYPPATALTNGNSTFGGFGGMGIVQFVTKVGHNTDGTNTHFDDFVRIIDNGAEVFGMTKQRYIAWRGWRDANGVPTDDFGNPTNIGSDEGDVRPSPFLLPLLGL